MNTPDTPQPCALCGHQNLCLSHRQPLATIHDIMSTMDDTLNPKIIAGIYNLEPMESQLLLKQPMEYHEACADQRRQHAG